MSWTSEKHKGMKLDSIGHGTDIIRRSDYLIVKLKINAEELRMVALAISVCEIGILVTGCIKS